MKAIYFDGERPEFRTNYPKPDPCSGESLIKVELAGICNTDTEIIKGYMGFKGVMGHEFVGTVESGPLKGKRVVGEINLACRNTECPACASKTGRAQNHCLGRSVLGIKGKNGCFAEYITLPDSNLHEIPDDIPNEKAVFTEPLAAAFRIPEQVEIGDGNRVAVFGDGKLGLLAAQVLSLSGCELFLVGKHRDRLDILEGIGSLAGGRITAELADRFCETVDIAVDCTGNPDGFKQALASVRPEGTLVVKSTFARGMAFNPSRLVVDEIKLVGSRCGPFGKAIDALKKGDVAVEPLISGVYPLENYKHAFKAAQSGLKIIIEM